MKIAKQIPYSPIRVSQKISTQRGDELLARLRGRRSVRHFSSDPVPRELIETAVRAAGTAPSGAHMQPWTFACISTPELKKQIRIAAEREEKETYDNRMSDEWRDALAPLGTTWEKPYLETVPWIVILFAQRFGLDDTGAKKKHYYVSESCGIAAGMFISALNEMGLCTLTHTPAPMGFLAEILERPKNEQAMILFPVGYAAEDATVPDIARKQLDEISIWR